MKSLILALALTAGAMAQVYPSAIAGDSDLPRLKNSPSTTLATTINNSATTIVLTSGTLFTSNMVLTIGTERIKCGTLSTNTYTGCTRGYDGSSAASHSSGTAVKGLLVAANVNNALDEIKAIETLLGANGNGKLGSALKIFAAHDIGGDDTYAANATSGTCPAALADIKVLLTVDTANTGAATFDFCSLGALAIKAYDGTTDPTTGDVSVGHHWLEYVDAATDYWRMEKVGGGGGSGTVNTGADTCVPFYSGAGTTLDDMNSTVCRFRWNSTSHALESYDSSGTKTWEVDADTGQVTTYGTASESVLTDISTPSAPGTAGQTALYTKAGQLATRANGGSEVLYPQGNSSGEAIKGVAGAYDATSWNGNSETPTKDAVRDKIESLGSGGFYQQNFAGAVCWNAGSCIVATPWRTALNSYQVTAVEASGIRFITNSTDNDAFLQISLPTTFSSVVIDTWGMGDGADDYNITAPLNVAYSCVADNSTNMTSLSYTSIGTLTVTVTGGSAHSAKGSLTWSSGLCSANTMVYLRFRLNMADGDDFVLLQARITAA